MAKFVQEGEHIDYTPAADVDAGAVVVQQDLIGVAHRAIKAAEQGAIAVEGVFEFPKEVGAGKDIPAGKAVNWNTTTSLVTKSAGGSTKPLGKAVAAVGEDDPVVLVRLSQ